MVLVTSLFPRKERVPPTLSLSPFNILGKPLLLERGWEGVLIIRI
jgi:hypothetical protein